MSERTTAKLSQQQKVILDYLLKIRKGLDEYRARSDGIPWYPSKAVPENFHYTRSVSASFSRSIQRLEERGLVVRDNHRSGADFGLRRSDPSQHFQNFKVDYWGDAILEANGEPIPVNARTTRLQLTDLGIEIAKRLSSGKS